MELKSLSDSISVNCYKLRASVSEGLKSMMVYWTGGRLALGLVIQAFNEDEQRKNCTNS